MKEKLCHILVTIMDHLCFFTLCLTVYVEIIMRYVLILLNGAFANCNFNHETIYFLAIQSTYEPYFPLIPNTSGPTKSLALFDCEDKIAHWRGENIALWCDMYMREHCILDKFHA